MSDEQILEKLRNAVIEGNLESARNLAQEAIQSGIDPIRTVHDGLARGLWIVGERFEKLEVFLPQMILAADAMKAAMAVILPVIAKEKKVEMSLGKVVIGTVFGDIHDIGKNIVASMLQAGGFEVSDLGTQVSVERFVNKAQEVEAHIIALSSLMTITRTYQRKTIEYLLDAGLRKKYYVAVGGGAITPAWAEEIGADGYGENAVDAVKLCKRLLTDRPVAPLEKPIIVEGDK